MDISLFRAVAHEYRDLRRVSSVPMMRTISHLIEDQVIAHGQPIDFYAGFQRFSNILVQQRRYKQLGAVCRRVYVFGVADIEPPAISGVEYIPLDLSDLMAREWFLLVNTPDFWVSLLTQESVGRDDLTGGRRYDGVWTYDAQVVDRAALLLSQALQMYYRPVVSRNSERQATYIADISARLLGRLERSRLVEQRRWAHLCTLHKFAEALAKKQEMIDLLWDAVQILRIIFCARDAAVAIRSHDDHYTVVMAQGENSVRDQVLHPGEGPSGKALQTQRPVRANSATQDYADDPLLPHGPHLLAVPIMSHDETHGVITLAGTEQYLGSEEDCQTVVALASMLAGVIEQRAGAAVEDDVRLLRAAQLQQALGKLRRPVARLLQLQQTLHSTEPLQTSPTQQAILAESATITTSLAQVLGVTGSLG